MSFLRRFLPLVSLGAAALLVRELVRGRDPVRLPRPAQGEVLSPADGVVAFVRRIEAGMIGSGEIGGAPTLRIEELTGQTVGQGWLIGLLTTPLDPRYVYAPVGGTVGDVGLTGGPGGGPLLRPVEKARLLSGQPTDLLTRPNLLGNERHTTRLDTGTGEVSVTLVAGERGLGALAYARPGDILRPGQKLAFLEGRSGAVLLGLPAPGVPQVSVGDRVTGGETVVARLPHPEKRSG